MSKKRITNAYTDNILAKKVNYVSLINKVNIDSENLFAVNCAGLNENVGISFTDLNNANVNFIPPTVAQTLSLVSTSADDAFGGTGVNIMVVIGLDEDYNKTTQTVFLTGLTPVVVSGTWLAVNDIRVVSFGNLGVSAGNITMTDVAVNLWYSLGIGETFEFVGRYTVPADHTFHINGTSFSTGANGDFSIEIMSNIGGLPLARIAYSFSHANSASYIVSPSPIPEKSTVKVRVKKEVGGGGGSSCTGYIYGNVVKNKFISDAVEMLQL